MPYSSLSSKAYSCTTCRKSRGIVLISGIHKVKCSPKGLRDLPSNGCPGWVGEDPLEGWPERIGEDVDVMKWRGRGGT